MKENNKIFKVLFLLPVIIYTLLLILLPLLYVLFLSFCKNDSYGGIIYEFTLSNYFNIFDITYLKIFLKSILIAALSTFICILI